MHPLREKRVVLRLYLITPPQQNPLGNYSQLIFLRMAYDFPCEETLVYEALKMVF